jgi:endonuclease-3
MVFPSTTPSAFICDICGSLLLLSQPSIRKRWGVVKRSLPGTTRCNHRRAPVEADAGVGGRRQRTRFDVDAVIARLSAEAPAWNAPVVTFIAVQTSDPFRVLISCLLSLRTKDQTTGPAARRLFALADTPASMLALSNRQIERTIYPVGFYRTKARVIREICRTLVERYEGRVPDDLDELLTLKGVGRKTANLVVTQGFRKPGICVDTHVHRISNRWGYVRTANPHATEMALRRKLPRTYWLVYNDLLVAFGQTICTPTSPWCSRCPVQQWCPRRGVVRHR